MRPFLKVENRVSLHRPKDGTAGRWNINGDRGTITLFLPRLWEFGSSLTFEENHIDNLILQIGHTFLIERICIERAHEKIIIKGGRCKPSCHVAPLAEFMTDYLTEGIPG